MEMKVEFLEPLSLVRCDISDFSVSVAPRLILCAVSILGASNSASFRVRDIRLKDVSLWGVQVTIASESGDCKFTVLFALIGNKRFSCVVLPF